MPDFCYNDTFWLDLSINERTVLFMGTATANNTQMY